MIVVTEYNSEWPQLFERLRDSYQCELNSANVETVSIEHVGSTSVPGLASKPIIDIDIVVTQMWIEAASKVLVGMGFRPLGELGIPQRWAFREPERITGTNTYVVLEGGLSYRNHIALRDTLRTNDDLREEYAATKRAAGRRASTIEEYGGMKNATIQRILAVAGLTRDELESINANQAPLRDEVH